MQSALTQFCANANRARDLAGLANALSAQTTQALDGSDLLRAALVLAVSALDHFVHEVTRKGMVEIALGERAPTDTYYRFQVSLRGIATFPSALDRLDWLDQEIREKHGWLSFQEPSKIADALRHVTGKDLWHEVGLRLDLPSQDVKARLKLTVDRRNKIAHEADMDPTAPGSRWPVDSAMVFDAIDFLESIARAIVNLLQV